MNKTTRIYPARKLIVARFTGAIDYEDIMAWMDEVAREEGFSPDYDGIVDLREVELKQKRAEKARLLAEYMIQRDWTKGRWAVMVGQPMETALALVYSGVAGQQHPIKVMATVSAAANFLNKDLSDLGLE